MAYPIQIRISWRPTYQTYDEPSHDPAYNEGNDEEIVSYDCFNFLRSGTSPASYFYGYFPLKRLGEDADIDLSRIDPDIGSAESVECPMVFWVARRPLDNAMCLIGWYENATVFSSPQPFPPSYLKLHNSEGQSFSDLKYRIRSKRAVLIPEEYRPAIGDLRDFGLNQKHAINRHLFLDERAPYATSQQKYRQRLEQLHLQVESLSFTNIADSMSIKETRAKILSERLERQGQYHHVRARLGSTCQSCGFDPHSTREPNVSEKCLEVHHKVPYSELAEGETRFLGLEHYALLCANCHRAIHASGRLDDIEGLSKLVLPR